jgi:hypothetical protein
VSETPDTPPGTTSNTGTAPNTGTPGVARLRVQRGLAAARLAARGGARYTRNAPRLFRAAGEQRQRLRNDLALQTA